MEGINTMSDMKSFNEQVIEEFRANEGKVGGMFEGAPMILLTTVGAKSGEPRISPLVYTTDGDQMVIIASKGGAPSNPDWYYNLVANPVATAEVGTEAFPVTATEATGDERKRLFDQMAAIMPYFAEYQRNTDREIPVFTLTRTA